MGEEAEEYIGKAIMYGDKIRLFAFINGQKVTVSYYSCLVVSTVYSHIPHEELQILTPSISLNHFTIDISLNLGHRPSQSQTQNRLNWPTSLNRFINSYKTQQYSSTPC